MSKNPNDDFDGVTTKDCCNACGPNKCVITGNQFCGHPLKSSHPNAGPKVVGRIAAVKKILAHQKVEAA